MQACCDFNDLIAEAIIHLLKTYQTTKRNFCRGETNHDYDRGIRWNTGFRPKATN